MHLTRTPHPAHHQGNRHKVDCMRMHNNHVSLHHCQHRAWNQFIKRMPFRTESICILKRSTAGRHMHGHVTEIASHHNNLPLAGPAALGKVHIPLTIERLHRSIYLNMLKRRRPVAPPCCRLHHASQVIIQGSFSSSGSEVDGGSVAPDEVTTSGSSAGSSAVSSSRTSACCMSPRARYVVSSTTPSFSRGWHNVSCPSKE